MVIITCGAIAKEVLLIANQLGQQDAFEKDAVEVVCISAVLHNHPEKIPDAVEEKILEARAQQKEVFVAFADCGTGGLLDDVLAKYDVERIPGAHCYQFFTGHDAFETLAEEELGTLYLTDFLARSFNTFIIKGLGIDRHPELQAMYFGNYKRLVYLAQLKDESLEEKAQQAAERLGLDYEYRYTGFGELGTVLEEQFSARAANSQALNYQDGRL